MQSLVNKIRIEPDWNVNTLKALLPAVSPLIRIEPDWNVNSCVLNSILPSIIY